MIVFVSFRKFKLFFKSMDLDLPWSQTQDLEFQKSGSRATLELNSGSGLLKLQIQSYRKFN